MSHDREPEREPVDVAAPSDAAAAKTVLVVMVIAFVGKVMGLLRDRMQAINFGAHTTEAIAFAQASFVPRAFLEVFFSAAFAAGFIPVLSRALQKDGKTAAMDLAAVFVGVVFAASAAVAALGAVFAGPLFAASLGLASDSDIAVLGGRLLAIMMLLIPLCAVTFCFAAMHQAFGRFKIPAAMSIFSNTVILAYYALLVDRFGVTGLAVAFIGGFFLQGIVHVPALCKIGFFGGLARVVRAGGLRLLRGRGILALMLPVLAGSFVVPINVQVNVRAAAGVMYGVNAVFFAHGLFVVTSGLFVLSVGNVLLPRLSKQFAAGDDAAFARTAGAAIGLSWFLLLPIGAGLGLVAHPLVRFVYGGGLFGYDAAAATAAALVGFAPGVVGFGAFTVFSRICFARHSGKPPLVAAICSVVANAALSFALVPIWGIYGAGLAGGLGLLAGGAVLGLHVITKIRIGWGAAWIFFAGSAINAAIMFAGVRGVLHLLDDTHDFVQLATAGIVGAGIYFGLARLYLWRYVVAFTKKENDA